MEHKDLLQYGDINMPIDERFTRITGIDQELISLDEREGDSVIRVDLSLDGLDDDQFERMAELREWSDALAAMIDEFKLRASSSDDRSSFHFSLEEQEVRDHWNKQNVTLYRLAVEVPQLS